MNEQVPSPERVDLKQRIIEGLRERGADDPETMELFRRWMDERIREVERIPNAADNTAYVRAQIGLNLERARIYLAAGRRDLALADFDDARLQAEQEGQEDLIRSIDDEVRPLEKGQ
ncbi:MAG: hypothetical protein AAB601_00230 [Patescibacteria group bacterium]